MKYKLQMETKPKLSAFGKYKAVAVHQQTIGTKEITQECVGEKIPLDTGSFVTYLSADGESLSALISEKAWKRIVA